MTAGQDMGISQLAEMAGVSVRTVRFYVSLGLLDRPGGRGRAATYASENLDRLRLVRTLVDKRVPLREIQETVGRMDARDVRGLLAQEERQSSHEREARAHSPREYVSALLERARATGSLSVSPRRAPDSSLSAPSAPPQTSPAPRAPQERARRPAQGPVRSATAWRRISLAPGLELHLDLDMEEIHTALVERILTLAGLERRRETHGNEQSD